MQISLNAFLVGGEEVCLCGLESHVLYYWLHGGVDVV